MEGMRATPAAVHDLAIEYVLKGSSEQTDERLSIALQVKQGGMGVLQWRRAYAEVAFADGSELRWIHNDMGCFQDCLSRIMLYPSIQMLLKDH